MPLTVEQKAKKAKWAREKYARLSADPVVGEQLRAHGRASSQRHRDKPEIKARDEAERQTPEYKAKQRARRLAREYGLAGDAYSDMVAGQNGRCAICHAEDPQLYVDHCHDSERVRALLCNSCNVSIGHMNDDPARLRAAADYIEQHRSETQQVGE